jgi:hypothetical protein
VVAPDLNYLAGHASLELQLLTVCAVLFSMSLQCIRQLKQLLQGVVEL